ncbi:hypothetical protein U1Q18_000639, partial [Sarracenia purpurea var. burkii]
SRGDRREEQIQTVISKFWRATRTDKPDLASGGKKFQRKRESRYSASLAVSNDIQRLQGRKFSGGKSGVETAGEEDGFWRMISVFRRSGYGHLSGEASLTLAKLQAFLVKSQEKTTSQARRRRFG